MERSMMNMKARLQSGTTAVSGFRAVNQRRRHLFRRSVEAEFS
jgi:hypothetical protein